jgi:DNA invertase Pin-like site-specific DNA recombinase
VDARGSVSARTKLFAAFAQFELEIMKERQRRRHCRCEGARKMQGQKAYLAMLR